MVEYQHTPFTLFDWVGIVKTNQIYITPITTSYARLSPQFNNYRECRSMLADTVYKLYSSYINIIYFLHMSMYYIYWTSNISRICCTSKVSIFLIPTYHSDSN